MFSGTATIVDVARKKPSSGGKRGRPSGRKETVPLYARVDPGLATVFKAYVDTIKPKTSDSAMIGLLIEQFLTDKGLWPPADQPPAAD